MKKPCIAWKALLWAGGVSVLIFSGCELFDGDDNNDTNGSKTRTVTDIDGNEYQSVKLWEHLWMTENLRTTRYRDGTPITTGLSAEDWASASEGAYTIYPHSQVEGIGSDEAMDNAYGLLYNWAAATDSRGICPSGWRVPESGEWSDLRDFVMDFVDEKPQIGGVGNALRAARQVGHPWGGEHDTNVHPRWNENTEHYGWDEFDFAAYAAGFRTPESTYQDLGYVGGWWSTTEQSASDAIARYIWSWENFMIRRPADKRSGLSVRCIRDAK